MKSLTSLFAVLIGFAAAAAPSAFGASVTLPDFSTSWSGGGTVSRPHVESSDQWMVNLDDRTGLTPGADILITVTTSDHFLWLGGFKLAGGPFAISAKATLALLLGEESAEVSALLHEDYGTVTGEQTGGGGAVVTDPVGYIFGPGLPALEIIVPWDTDLTKAVFRLSQVSDISGPGFNSSSITVSGGNAASASSTFAVSFVSVPEPSSGAMLLAVPAFAAAARRRRRA